MKHTTCGLLLLVAVLPAFISAFPSTVIINGVCLTCANPNGEPVYIDGDEYRSFSRPGSNVIVSRPGQSYGNGRSTVYRNGGTTIVNGRCEICNVEP